MSESRWESPQDVYDYETGESGKIWRYKADPKLTVEYHPLTQEEFGEEEEIPDEPHVDYYVFPAYDGRGLPNSPMITDTRGEAERITRNLRRLTKKELLEFRTEPFPWSKLRERSVSRRPLGSVSVRRHVRRRA